MNTTQTNKQRVRFYTLQQIAFAAGVKPSLLQKYARESIIPAKRNGVRNWVILAEDIDKVRDIFPGLNIALLQE